MQGSTGTSHGAYLFIIFVGNNLIAVCGSEPARRIQKRRGQSVNKRFR
jgi:hypothetical protein